MFSSLIVWGFLLARLIRAPPRSHIRLVAKKPELDYLSRGEQKNRGRQHDHLATKPCDRVSQKKTENIGIRSDRSRAATICSDRSANVVRPDYRNVSDRAAPKITRISAGEEMVSVERTGAFHSSPGVRFNTLSH